MRLYLWGPQAPDPLAGKGQLQTVLRGGGRGGCQGLTIFP
jgi:hypothetical protein